jgi:hypothetical protein
MAKPLSFKDFMVVDYLPGTGEYISYQAKKRKQDIPTGNTNEALSHSQRIKKRILMKKLAPRIKMARDRAMKRTPNMQVVKRRAEKQARNKFFMKLSRGVSKSELSPAKRSELEKRLDKMKPRIQRIAKRLIPAVRQQDRDRKAAAAAKKD